MTSVASVASKSRPEALLSQREVRFALFVAGVLNAIFYQVLDSVGTSGLLGAVIGTFGISAIVWVALALAALNLTRETESTIERREVLVDLAVLALVLLPQKHVAWVGLTLFALNVFAHSARHSAAARGSLMLLAVTVPMFWGKLVLSLFSGVVLTLDAMLVGTVLRLPRVGNTLALADGQTHLWIEASCSSMLNLSLVVLCWTMFCAVRGVTLRRGLPWLVLCAVLVIGLNIARISLIAAFPEHYDMLHGGLGATVASWLFVAVMLCVFEFGMCRFRHAA